LGLTKKEECPRTNQQADHAVLGVPIPNSFFQSRPAIEEKTG
tara:strand:+ start:121 stop:246 length:126 start_codon:yes stop_codon:yes gene_type:complete